MTKLIGQSIGRYHILEQLGQGGMATVYKAFDTRLDSDVAVKVIRVDMFPPAILERVRKRFEREAKSLAKLNHPNIVSVIDYGEYEGGAPYLVMKYMPGGTLKMRLGKPIPYSEAAWILAPIARALAYAHQQGVLHRDVKPANILLTYSGEPVLTDFGIAKLLEEGNGQSLTGTGVGIGTPEYMAPEQGLGTNIDGRADVYALGIVMFELFTGRKPFSADTPLAVLYKQMNDPLPRLRDFSVDLPDKVEHVVYRSLAKKPEDRFKDMAEFARALENLAQSTSISLPIQKTQSTEMLSQSEVKTCDDINISNSDELSSVEKQRKETKIAWKRWLPIAISFLLLVILLIGFLVPWNNRAKIQFLKTTAFSEESADAIANTVFATEVDRLQTSVIKGLDDTNAIETSTPITQNPTDLFFEDFEDRKVQKIKFMYGDWKIVTDESENRVYEMDNSKGYDFPGFDLGKSYWRDYSIEFRMRIIGSGEGWTIVYFRDKYVISIDTHNTSFNWQDNSLGWQTITNREFHLEKEKWHYVRIDAIGSEIKVVIDDDSVIYTDDTRFEAGDVTFQVGQLSHVQLDDIRVVTQDSE